MHCFPVALDVVFAHHSHTSDGATQEEAIDRLHITRAHFLRTTTHTRVCIGNTHAHAHPQAVRPFTPLLLLGDSAVVHTRQVHLTLPPPSPPPACRHPPPPLSLRTSTYPLRRALLLALRVASHLHTCPNEAVWIRIAAIMMSVHAKHVLHASMWTSCFEFVSTIAQAREACDGSIARDTPRGRARVPMPKHVHTRTRTIEAESMHR